MLDLAISDVPRHHLDRSQDGCRIIVESGDLPEVAALVEELPGVCETQAGQLLHRSLDRDPGFLRQPVAGLGDRRLNIRFRQVLMADLPSRSFAVASTNGRLGGVQINQIFLDEALLLWAKGHGFT